MSRSIGGKFTLGVSFFLIAVAGMITGCSKGSSEGAVVNQPVPSEKTAQAAPPSSAPAQAQEAIKSSQAQSAAMQSRAMAQGEAMRKAQEAAQQHR